MTWATDCRLDTIDWLLLMEGSVRRGDLMQIFGVSESQASKDLGEFDRAHPGAMRYDLRAKQYVPTNGRYVSQRGVKRARPLVFAIER
jgi:hypothetical protein